MCPQFAFNPNAPINIMSPGRPNNSRAGLPSLRKGRPNRSSNRAKRIAREAIGAFVDGNVHRLGPWLEKIEAVDGPLAAFKCFADLLEYHVPKLQRIEHTGDNGDPLAIVNLTLPADPAEAIAVYQKIIKGQ